MQGPLDTRYVTGIALLVVCSQILHLDLPADAGADASLAQAWEVDDLHRE